MTKHDPAIVLVVVAQLAMTSAAAAQEQTVIRGQVVDDAAKAPPKDPVVVWYEEFGGDYEPVHTRTVDGGLFTITLPIGMGARGLLAVREPGYNTAVLTWPAEVDRDAVLRLFKPVPIYGKVIDASGAPVSGTALKWSMRYDNRLTSGMGHAAQDGTFEMLVPARSEDLRLAAWAELYAPTATDFSYDHEAAPETVLETLESMQRDARTFDGEPQYIQDWVNEILASQESTAEPLAK